MSELPVFNAEPGEPHPPATGAVLLGGQEGGGAGEQVQVEPGTLPWPEGRDTTAQAQSDSYQEEEEEWAEAPESLTESTRELGADESSKQLEVKKWEDEESDGGVQDGDDSSLADDEEEEEDESQVNWTPEKVSYAFNPLVTIVWPARKQEERPGESLQHEGTAEKLPEPLTMTQQHRIQPQSLQPQSLQPHSLPAQAHQPQWIQTMQQPSRGCPHCCNETVRLIQSLLAAVVVFPFLVWAGYELLPFKSPSLSTAPLRLVYTMRCAFFATFPIVLGFLVQGVSRLKFGVLRLLFSGRQLGREVVVHGNYARDSLHLYLLYFIQLAVMATYINQDMLKLVPLLTIIFVFGRLIYWTSVCLGSSVRALGFGLSFLPLLVLLGVNLYFICSSIGPEAVFDVAPPTTPPPPPPKLSWWG